MAILQLFNHKQLKAFIISSKVKAQLNIEVTASETIKEVFEEESQEA